MIEPARQQPVQAVAHSGQNQNSERQRVTVILDGHDKARKKGETQKRELIGDGQNPAFHRLVPRALRGGCQANSAR